MASTWSALKVELQGTGDNSGTWGTATNVNLGDAVLGEAITGSATVNFPSAADVTITLTDVATTQSARNLRLNITESGAGIGYVGNLILGSGCQIEKFYLVRNNGTGAKTIKNTTGTGISVPAGKATLVYNDGTNVVDVLNSFSSAILGAENAGSIIPFYFANQAAFPSASTYHGAIAHSHADAAMYFAHGGVWTMLIKDGGPLGTPSSGTLTLATGLPLTSGVTGLLPVANGGTATATPALVQGSGVTITGTWPNQTINATGTGGTVTSVGGTGTVNGISLSGTVTSSGSLTLGGTLSGVNLTSQVTGTLPVANGGTGVTASTGSGSVVLSTSPSLTTPVLGTPSSGTLSSCTVDGTNKVGYLNIPQSGSAKTTSYTLAVGDVGEYILLGASGAIVIPDATFAAGDVVTIFNNTASTATITCSITTAYIAGTFTDKATMTLAAAGVATALFITSTLVVVSGNVT